MIRFNRWQDGKTKALTLSYDDGHICDTRLTEIFNANGLKASFHLNSGFFNREGETRFDDYVHADNVRGVYAGHEISQHSVFHPALTEIPREELIDQMLSDRKALEAFAQYPVRGMSYPFGIFNDDIIPMLKALGVEYARTIRSTGSFAIPEDFMRWDPTCHHNDRLLERTDDFLALSGGNRGGLALFYVWGHSFEFDPDNNWDMIETFAERIGGKPDIYYATNIEIMDYLIALCALRFSADRRMVYNPSAIPVWFTDEYEPVCVKPGETKHL